MPAPARRTSRQWVRFGDIVTLESPDMGFISASGAGGSCRADLLEAPVQMPPNIRNCCFQIYPHFRYAGHEALKKLQSEGRGNSSKALALQQSVQADDEHNRRELESFFGSEVRYGMVVQLFHLSTGKFLTAGHAIAKLERDCLRVSLEQGTDGSNWTVCPIFKFQRSGDPLQYQDDFHLEASSKRGFLHISEVPDRSAVSLSSYVKETYEVNCGHLQCRLRFRPFRDGRVHATRSEGGRLFGDDVVTIQLREHDALLAAQIGESFRKPSKSRGNPAATTAVDWGEGVDGPEVRFFAHERSRLRADSVWKIESETVTHAGEAVTGSKPFRVRHIASGLYLTLVDPSAPVQELCLTSDYYRTDDSTLWDLVPVSEEEHTIHDATPLHLRNACSGYWLQAVTTRGAPRGDARAVCNESKDTSQYVYLVPVDDEHDTTTIDLLREYRLQFVELVGIISNREDIEEKWEALRTYGEAALQGLGECVRLCVRGDADNPLELDGEVLVENQHLMHEMGVLQVLVSLIHCLANPFSAQNGGSTEMPEEVAKFLRLAYWLLKQTCKNQQEVKRHLAQHVDLFAQHVPLRVRAARALREILKDNRRLLMDVSPEIVERIIEKLVESYRQRRKPRSLQVFESICVCHGVPVPFIQNHLTKCLLQKYPDALPTLVGRAQELRIAGDKLSGGHEVNPRDFLGTDPMLEQNDENTDEVEFSAPQTYELLLRTLELFAAMATGRNAVVSAELQKPRWNLSREVLILALRDPGLPPAFRGACLSILQRLYIDQGDRRVVPAVTHTRIWSEALHEASQTPQHEVAEVANSAVLPSQPPARPPGILRSESQPPPSSAGDAAAGPPAAVSAPPQLAPPALPLPAAAPVDWRSGEADAREAPAAELPSSTATNGRSGNNGCVQHTAQDQDMGSTASNCSHASSSVASRRGMRGPPELGTLAGLDAAPSPRSSPAAKTPRSIGALRFESEKPRSASSSPRRAISISPRPVAVSSSTIAELEVARQPSDGRGWAATRRAVLPPEELGGLPPVEAVLSDMSADGDPAPLGAVGTGSRTAVINRKVSWRHPLMSGVSRGTWAATAFRKAGEVESSNVEEMVDILVNVLRETTNKLPEHKFAPAHVLLANQLLETLRLLAEFGMLRLGDPQERALVAGLADALVDFLSLQSTTKHMQVGKMIACELLERIFALRTDLRLGRLFSQYEKTYTRPEEWPALFKSMHEALFGRALISEKVKNSNPFFSNTLINTLSSGVDLQVKSKCLMLLFSHTFQRASLVREAQKVTVLASPEAVHVYHQAEDAVGRFGTLFSELASEVEDGEENNQRARSEVMQLLSRLTALCTPSTTGCRGAKTQGYSPDVVTKHQDVLADLGVQKYVLQILQLPLHRTKHRNSLDEAVDPGRCDVFRHCYSFLCAFVKGNPRNQEMMFQHINLFTSHIGVRNLDAAGTVAAVVQDNHALVMQLRDTDLRIFVQSIAKYGKEARWLRMLQNVVLVNGQRVRRNQHIVLDLLLEEQDFVLELDGDQEGATVSTEAYQNYMPRSPSKKPSLIVPMTPGTVQMELARASSWEPAVGTERDRTILYREGNKTRLQLMAEREYEEGESSFLVYHATCVELLAQCCAGKSQGNQSKCRNLMSLEEVMKPITSCHLQADGSPHPLVTPEAIRFVRGPFLQFLHHCYVDAAQHDLFKGVPPLWRRKPDSLGGVFMEELEAFLHALQKADAEDNVESEQVDFIFRICLPVIADLVKHFTPAPVPDMVFDIITLAAECCKAFPPTAWSATHVAHVRNFFTTINGLDLVEDLADSMIELLEGVEKGLCQRAQATEELKAANFRTGFKHFMEGYAVEIGVDPRHIVGHGFHHLVGIVVERTDLLQFLAEVISTEMNGPPERMPFLLNCIRAIRGYLCGITLGGESESGTNWEAFASGRVPTDGQLRARQEIAARRGVIAALAQVLSNTSELIIRETLLTLQVVFAPSTHNHEPAQAAQAALVEYVRDEDRRRHFIASCVEVVRNSVQGLKARELMLQKRKDQKEAMCRKQRRRSSNNMEQRSAVSVVSDDPEISNDGHFVSALDLDHMGELPDLPDEELGLILELLVVLTFCTHGVRAELQNLFFATGAARTLQQEDFLAELVRYLVQSEHLLSFAMANKNQHPLKVALQAYAFMREVICGPNVRAMEVLIHHTALVEVTRNFLRQVRCDGQYDELKFQVQNSILMFILTMLQNLGMGHRSMVRKWVSLDCDQVLLEAWDEAYACAMSAVSPKSSMDRIPKKRMEQQTFLHFAVLRHLAEAAGSASLAQEIAAREPAATWCGKQCGSIEVLRGDKLYQLHFRVPEVCESFERSERFASAVTAVVRDCVAAEDKEDHRPALFQKKIVELIKQEVRQYELVGRGFLGLLVSYQNWVLRLPLVVTLVINVCLLLFESLIFYAQANGAAPRCTAAASGGDVDEKACSAPAPSAPRLYVARATTGALTLLALVHLVCYVLRLCFVWGTSTKYRWLLTEALLMVFSLAGNIVSPFFFVVHVLEFFSGQSARMLLASATLNLTKLGQAGLIMMLTVYVYAVIGFMLFKDKHADGKCSTLLNCAVSYLDGGLTGDGIHETLKFETPHSVFDSQLMEWFLQLFAMSFLSIFVQVLLAIFSGVIIDSFGELRDRHAEVTGHLNEPGHLLSHSTHRHYVNFFVFLHVAGADDDVELTDLESYIYEEVQKGESHWLPYRHSMDLQKTRGPARQEEHERPNAQGATSHANEAVREQMAALAQRVEELCLRMERTERSVVVSGGGVPPVPRSQSDSKVDARREPHHEASPRLYERQTSMSNFGENSRSQAAASSTPRVLSMQLMRLERAADDRWAAVEEQMAHLREEVVALRSQVPAPEDLVGLRQDIASLREEAQALTPRLTTTTPRICSSSSIGGDPRVPIDNSWWRFRLLSPE